MGLPPMPFLALTNNKNPGKDIGQYTAEDLGMMPVQSKMEYEALMNWIVNSIKLQNEEVE